MQVFLVQTLWPANGKSCHPVMQKPFNDSVVESIGADGGQDCVPQGSLLSSTSALQSKNHWHIPVLAQLDFCVSSFSR